MDGTLARFGASGLVGFGGTNGTDGLQLFVSDGTGTGTTQLGPIGQAAGVGFLEIGKFATVGQSVFFPADDGIIGNEPWVASLSGGVVAWTQPFAKGCQGTNALVPEIYGVGRPSIGNASFGLGLRDARAQSFAVANLGFTPTNLRIDRRNLLIGAPLIALTTVGTSANGDAITPLPASSPASLSVCRH